MKGKSTLLLLIFVPLLFFGGCKEEKVASATIPAKALYPWGLLQPLQKSPYPTFRVRVNYDADLYDLLKVDGIQLDEHFPDTPNVELSFGARAADRALATSNFPESRHGNALVEVLLISFDQGMPPVDAVREMNREGLRPADYIETLSFYAELKKESEMDCSGVPDGEDIFGDAKEDYAGPDPRYFNGLSGAPVSYYQMMQLCGMITGNRGRGLTSPSVTMMSIGVSSKIPESTALGIVIFPTGTAEISLIDLRGWDNSPPSADYYLAVRKKNSEGNDND